VIAASSIMIMKTLSSISLNIDQFSEVKCLLLMPRRQFVMDLAPLGPVPDSAGVLLQYAAFRISTMVFPGMCAG
jgi:hypothetical protein